LGLSGKKLPPVLEAFVQNACTKWTRIDLDENEISGPELMVVIEHLKK
jgi:hypothetical protein